MRPWKLSSYSPEPDVNPVRDWYEEQSEEIKAQFDVDIQFFRANDDWTEAFEVVALDGKYLGLHEILITVDLEDNEIQFGAVGAWRPDSCEFVLFLVCDRYNDSYFPCLDKALEYKQAWERKDPRGSVYEH